MFRYIVQPTDTLHFIALKFNIPVKELIYTNNLTDPHKVYPGQSLIIPDPTNIEQNGLPNLYPGCADNSFIILLQSQLAKLGYYKDVIDGMFNCMTHKAVISFQMDNNLKPSGFVNHVTWAKLFENAEISYDLPNYKARLIPPGVLIILSMDRHSYIPNDIMALTLLKINLTAKPLIFTYGTSQKYDFTINDLQGKFIWQWSHGKNFTRAPESICLPPHKTISYTEYINLASLPNHGNSKEFWAAGWNTAFQTHMVKMQVPLTIQGQS